MTEEVRYQVIRKVSGGSRDTRPPVIVFEGTLTDLLAEFPWRYQGGKLINSLTPTTNPRTGAEVSYRFKIWFDGSWQECNDPRPFPESGQEEKGLDRV